MILTQKTVNVAFGAVKKAQPFQASKPILLLQFNHNHLGKSEHHQSEAMSAFSNFSKLAGSNRQIAKIMLQPHKGEVMMSLTSTNTHSCANLKLSHLASLGWSSDDENSINVIELNTKAITKELLKRHSSERSNLPVKIEHAQDEASTFAIVSNLNPDAAANEAETVVLKKGLGVTFWYLTADKYCSWKETWSKRDLLIDRWLDTNGTGVLRTVAYEAIENEFFALFQSEPLVRIDLSCEAMELQKAQKIADAVLFAAIQKDG